MTDDDTRHQALMGALTAGVTHALSNPLAYMLANLDYVLAEMDRAAMHPETLEECMRALTQVKTGTLQLRALTRALRALAQPLGHTTTLDVSQLLESALLVTEGTWKHSATIEYAPPVAARVVADEALVMRWLTAQVLDALPARDTHERPRIVVHTAREGELLILSVAGGPGADDAPQGATPRLALAVARE